MLSVKDAVTTYFPTETIIKEKQVKLTDSWKNPFGISKYFYLSLVPMIETDKRYYFDRRVEYLRNLRKYLIPCLLGITVFVLLLWVYLWGQTSESFSLVIIILLFALFVNLQNFKINEGLTNIVVIDKSLVNKTRVEDGAYVIEGEISVADSYSFPAFFD